jgi:hypothetical protein
VSVPQPMAVDGETTYDPATGSVLVKVGGFGASFGERVTRRWWRRLAVSVNRLFTRILLVAVSSFEVNLRRWMVAVQAFPNDYRRLAGAPAIATVDKGSGAILSVRFRSRP